MGDFNHGNIKWDSQQSTGVEDQKLLCLVQDNFLTQHVLEPTRAARVLDIVLSSQKEFVDNVVIQEPLGSSDHNQLHFNINIKSDKTKVKQCRRDFRRGNYDEIRKSLALIDWNDKMNNKTATECWNILRGELYSAIDSYVPMKKQGKRYKKKHLSKEAFRKIRYKQNMWRVYKHTGTDKDYDAYKEALNAATNEVRKSKRNFEHKLAQNIKSDSKSFYAYVRSKQNVRDKVGPLVDNAGNIITQGFLMAEELNMHFSSVFTREDTSSIPVPETKFKGSEGERLGQLVVTPEVVVSKINNMKENKSPGVDGISPKILKETVEQISTPLAHVFNMSLKEGIVPFEWKEANIIPLFKKGSRNKSVNYRPVSLTSVICKLLETIIRDATDAARSVVQALITSRLDYCNSLLANLTNTQMKRLKSIQHKAARLVTRTPLREHITPVLKQLHWLPVECRITYKLMVLVYKCVNGTAPAYLCRLIQPKCRDSRLRQPSDLELHRPVPKKAIGTAAFGFVGPDRWNKLPERLRESASLNIFKRDLKTHLFSNPL